MREIFLNVLEGKRKICLCKESHAEKTGNLATATGVGKREVASQLNKFYYLSVSSLAQSQDTQQGKGLGRKQQTKQGNKRILSSFLNSTRNLQRQETNCNIIPF
jgi:hypothetical protein